MPFKPFPAMQAGSETTDASGNKTVTFPTPFSAVPKVFLQGKDAAAKGIVLDIVSVSTTQFAVKARKVTGLTTDSKLGSHSHTVSSHTHSIGSPSKASFVTGGTKYSKSVASSTHTHAIGTQVFDTGSSSVPGVDGAHTHTYLASRFDTYGPSATTTVMYDLTFTTASAVTGIPSSTGSRSPGTSSVNLAHSHSVGAPVLAINFDYLAIGA